ncbi:HAD domain-containing protein [Demequina salsinemoris]|uniref:HAD domain-containing protein n=1 Tax=Demequina salsinemoris TaxID=577470 RepID=UPI0007857B78|nr:hypothetical protein [Demequina salsinemoris]
MSWVLLLLDVDGVISPMAPPGSHGGSWPEASWEIAPVGGMLGTEYSTEMIGQLRRIASLPGVDGAWCTTWGPMAPKRLAPVIGLGRRWPALEPGPHESHFCGPGWWKAARAREEVARHDAVVWVDDLIDPWREALDDAGLAGPESWPGGRLLAVSPAPDEGLSPQDLAEIGAFVRHALRANEGV